MAFAKSSFQMVILALLVIFLLISADSRTKTFTSAFCSVSDPDFTVVFLNEPHYVIANGTKYGNGLIYDFVKAGLAHCFRQYNCNTKNVIWIRVSSQDKLRSYILNGTADIAIPIAPSPSSTLTEELKGSDYDRVTLLGVLKSPGLAMVIDYNACKTEDRGHDYQNNHAFLACLRRYVATGRHFVHLHMGIDAIITTNDQLLQRFEQSVSFVDEDITEMRHDQKEFPSSFGRGSSEGFWWAIVTMTIVG